ncbi:zinc-binding alcohol dehydrogenase family protein [Plebeiibacterium marinum]|uniref:Zinc-binding alcohol dehydrogenase family protein n=1 Tax=Plebeiibacterium marinum TaxID=2992111 RepID=A0AAE3ME03_9BACT|nr:zinc-binding alcohol dehydrogenase family protein [Plebeiobacterium marinum]MCW3805857.1 zinc-binding alcohol dehydrogenase family protein [Plebeiobacterium marinum]
MKAVVIEKPGVAMVVNREKPVIKQGEVLLKIKYVGFCGSDLTTYLGKNPMVNYPRIPGHEISAVIHECADGVPENYTVGKAVTVIPYSNCGQCPSCKAGREYACQFNQTLGVQRDGAMCEYVSVPWQKLLMAEGLSDVELALIEPLTVGFHAVERGRVTDGDTVLVFGCGMIGVGAIVRSVLRGAKVIAVDIDDEKLKIAKELGVQHTINSLSEDLSLRLKDIEPGGPSVIVEAAGNPKTYLSAVQEIAFTGRVVCIGYAKEEVSFATKLFVQKEMDILGSRNATANDFRAVISYLGRGVFPVDKMVTEIVEPEKASQVLNGWSKNPGKVFKILLEFN